MTRTDAPRALVRVNCVTSCPSGVTPKGFFDIAIAVVSFCKINICSFVQLVYQQFKKASTCIRRISGRRREKGLIHCGFFKSVSRFTKKKLSAFAELFSLVRETGLDSRGSTPLGQRRSQAPPGLDSLRLLQVRFSVYKKRSPAFLPSFFLLVRETGLEPA